MIKKREKEKKWRQKNPNPRISNRQKNKTTKTIPTLKIIQKFIQIPENKPKNTTHTTLNIEENSTKRSLWLR